MEIVDEDEFEIIFTEIDYEEAVVFLLAVLLIWKESPPKNIIFKTF